MANKVTDEKRSDLIRQFTALAQEYHRTGDTVMRDQAIRDLREVAPPAVADKIIAEISGT